MLKMNRAGLRLGTVTVAALAIAGVAAATPSLADPGDPAAQAQKNSELAKIKDPALRTCVSNALNGKPASTLTRLECPQGNMNSSIKDLTGISVLKNVTEMTFNHAPGGSGTLVSDLRPLSGMTKLTYLSVANSQVSDLRPLSGLTNLTDLILFNNQISDIRPLSGLKKLTVLDLCTNKISNLQPLAGLTNLTDLAVCGNHQISDLRPLSRLTNLTRLNLNDNKISNLQPLSRLTNLTYLNLDGNNISDIKPLAEMTKLNELSLSENKITSIAPLAKIAANEARPEVPLGLLLANVFNETASGSPVTAGKATPIVLKNTQGKAITDLTFSGPGTPTVNKTTGTVTYPVAGTYKVTWKVSFGTMCEFNGTLTQQVTKAQPRR